MRPAISAARRGIPALLAALACATPARAFIQSGNQRLDHALWPEHAQKWIVAGTLGEIRRHAPGGMLPPEIEFDFAAETVLLGAPAAPGTTLVVPVSHFIWPTNLVAFETGARAILVFSRETFVDPPGLGLCTVLPGGETPPPAARDGAEALRILEDQLLAALRTAATPARRQSLLLQLAPILSAARAAEIEPFLASDDLATRRAALTGLVYATEQEAYLRQLADDLRHAPADDPTYRRGDPRYDAVPVYFFLEPRSWRRGSRWNGPEADKHLRILRALFATGLLDRPRQDALDPAYDAHPRP